MIFNIRNDIVFTDVPQCYMVEVDGRRLKAGGVPGPVC